MQNNIIENSNMESINLDSHAETIESSESYLPKQEGRSKRAENYERVEVRGKTQDANTRGHKNSPKKIDDKANKLLKTEMLGRKDSITNKKNIKEGLEEYYQEQNENPQDYGKAYDDEETDFNFTLENYNLHREQQEEYAKNKGFKISSFKIGNDVYLFQDYTEEEINDILNRYEESRPSEISQIKDEIIEDYYKYEGKTIPISNDINNTHKENQEKNDENKQNYGVR